MLKIQENVKNDNELFKQNQQTISEKITEMIKIEISNRLTSDVYKYAYKRLEKPHIRNRHGHCH